MTTTPTVPRYLVALTVEELDEVLKLLPNLPTNKPSLMSSIVIDAHLTAYLYRPELADLDPPAEERRESFEFATRVLQSCPEWGTD